MFAEERRNGIAEILKKDGRIKLGTEFFIQEIPAEQLDLVITDYIKIKRNCNQ